MVTTAFLSYVGSMNKKLPILFASLIIALSFLNVSSGHAADLMEDLRGDKRPLLLFSKSRSFAGLDQQMDILRDYRPDLQERDVVVLSTTGRQETQTVIGYTPVPRGTARLLRKQFQPSRSGLTVVLIGKDGTEKARWEKVVDPQTVFDLIDAMPMRQQEIKQAEQSG